MKLKVICKLFHEVSSEEIGGFYEDFATRYTCKTCGNTWEVNKPCF